MKNWNEITEKINEYMEKLDENRTGEAEFEQEEKLQQEWYYGIIDALLWVIGDESGKAIANAVTAEISGDNLVSFEFKITGFKDGNKDLKLAMGAYVAVNDGENTEYSYLQAGTPNENEKYCFVSYNEVVANFKEN